MNVDSDRLWELMQQLFRPHPWHGLTVGTRAPERVNVYVEIVPTDTVKYEIEKQTGYLWVDRPQQFSNVCPTLYGVIPQTFCGERFADLYGRKIGRKGIRGDEDPLDICVMTEKAFSHGDFLMQAIPIGGLRLIDGEEADDKIIGVMPGDAIYGQWRSIEQVPEPIIERLKHYFLTYKQAPDEPLREVEIAGVFDRKEAYEVIARSIEDYREKFGDPRARLFEALRSLPAGDVD